MITSLSGRRLPASVEIGQAFLKTARIVGGPILVDAIRICSRFAGGPEISPSQRITVFVSREGGLLVVSVLRNRRSVLSIVITDLFYIAFFIMVIFGQMDSILVDRCAAERVKDRVRCLVAIFVISQSIFRLAPLIQNRPVFFIEAFAVDPVP